MAVRSNPVDDDRKRAEQLAMSASLARSAASARRCSLTSRATQTTVSRWLGPQSPRPFLFALNLERIDNRLRFAAFDRAADAAEEERGAVAGQDVVDAAAEDVLDGARERVAPVGADLEVAAVVCEDENDVAAGGDERIDFAGCWRLAALARGCVRIKNRPLVQHRRDVHLVCQSQRSD